MYPRYDSNPKIQPIILNIGDDSQYRVIQWDIFGTENRALKYRLIYEISVCTNLLGPPESQTEQTEQTEQISEIDLISSLQASTNSALD